MAKDNDNGLYLPLKINLSEWEKDLAKADADLQQAMREMRSATQDLKLRYDVEIAGAKAAGDDLKVLELEERKLNQLYETQKKTVEALNKAYEQSVKEKGVSAKASQDLATQLVRESKQLDKIKTQIESKNLNVGKALSDGLSKVSPEFNRIREAVSGVTSNLTSLGGEAAIAAKAVAGIGVAAAGVAAAYGGIKYLSTSMRETAETAATASESVFMLAERLNLTYKEAEQLDAVFTLDGTSAEAFVNAVQKLNKQLLTAGEDGNLASAMLERFGVQLRNADGTQKSYIEQLQALADGYKKAKESGEGLDFITSTLGSGGNQFVHLLNGLDDYILKVKELVRALQVNYDINHENLTINGQLLLQQKELAKASGSVYGNEAIIAKKQELEFLKKRTELMNENAELYKEFGENMKAFNSLVITVEGNTSLWLDKLKNGLTEAAVGLARLFGFEPKLPEIKPEEVVQKKVKPIEVPIKLKKEKEKDDDYEKLVQQEYDKLKETYERFQRELRDTGISAYEREINAIMDKKQAYIDAGVKEVEAERLFTQQKEEIDKKYFEKINAERQKQIKVAEDAYNKEIEAAKKARESSISEAEQTVRNSVKILRYIKREQEKGTYNEQDTKAYVDRLYMRSNGIRQSDIDIAKQISIPKLQELMDSRNRLFGDFAQTTTPPITNNNNVTINFDGTVVEDVSAMDKLANKVAEIITPAIEQALRGGTEYGY